MKLRRVMGVTTHTGMTRMPTTEARNLVRVLRAAAKVLTDLEKDPQWYLVLTNLTPYMNGRLASLEKAVKAFEVKR